MAIRSMLPTALYRARDVRELDRLAIEVGGTPGIDLMERAGAAAFRVLRGRWPAARRVSVVAGPGNNGGDGFVVARLARSEGLHVSVDLVGDAARLAGDAAMAYRRMLDAGSGAITTRCGAAGDAATADRRMLDGASGGNTARRDTPGPADDADVIVDALFGTGLVRDVSGPAAEAVRAMNDAAAPVLALDVPSGIHSDTGRSLGRAVRAAVTVCFIGLKQGLFTREGRECAGGIAYRDLGVPRWVLERVQASARRMAYEDCAGMLGPRRGDAHKGRFGHVLVVGGDHGFAGAARLAGEAACRTGAGLVSVATRPGHAAAIVASRPEMMVHGVESPGELDALLDRATVVAVGPGLGRGRWGASLLERIVAGDHALVVDADALSLMSEGAAPWPGAGTRAVVYTPHPGEAGRVLGEPASVLESDRFSAARALAEAHPGTWLLKGAGTIVAEAGAVPRVCEGGNPGMASGGMGDVLTGVVAALLAQGLDGFDAASAGACLHAAAGDAAARDGGRGMLASDVIAALRLLADRL